MTTRLSLLIDGDWRPGCRRYLMGRFDAVILQDVDVFELRDAAREVGIGADVDERGNLRLTWFDDLCHVVNTLS